MRDGGSAAVSAMPEVRSSPYARPFLRQISGTSSHPGTRSVQKPHVFPVANDGKARIARRCAPEYRKRRISASLSQTVRVCLIPSIERTSDRRHPAAFRTWIMLGIAWRQN